MKNHCENKEINIIEDESGQTFLEFVLLIAVMISLSYVILAGVNGNIAKRWKIMVEIIASPTTTNIQVN